MAQKEDAPQQENKLLLISNRLPVTIKKTDEPGKFETSMSSGGLVSGLSGMTKTTTFQWYGWPGLEVPEDQVGALKKQLKEEYNAIPIMLDDDLADRHYNGMASTWSILFTTDCVVDQVHRRDSMAAISLSSW
jgi:trehalose 6-phosphate synthase